MRSNLTVQIITLFSIVLLLMSIQLNAQRGTRVGYIDMNVILESIDEYQEARATC